MENIQMVDLKGQYLKIKPEIDQALQRIIDSASFVKGPEVKGLEAELSEYMGCKETICCGNGTDALQIALMALDLQPGDEVITSDFSFYATVEVIALLKLKPVLVDIDPGTFNIDPEKVKKAITRKTKAIIPVHLFGQCSNMDAIMDIAKKNDLLVIEDSAQATGATYKTGKKAGTIGHIGCTSFFPSKNLGAYGDGGAIFTNDQELGEKIRTIANHGMRRRYYYDYIGVNSRLDTIQAAILRVKLKHLDEYNNARKAAAKFYDEKFQNLKGIATPFRDNLSEHGFHQYTLLCNEINRDELQGFLKQHSIPSMIYYPVPLHQQKSLGNFGYSHKDYPVSIESSKKVLSLPMHTELDNVQLTYITHLLTEFVSKYG